MIGDFELSALRFQAYFLSGDGKATTQQRYMIREFTAFEISLHTFSDIVSFDGFESLFFLFLLCWPSQITDTTNKPKDDKHFL